MYEYTNEFYKMWTRGQLTEMEVQVIHRYLIGLRPNVRNLVELQPCWMLSSVVQLVMKVESQQRWSNNHPIKSVRGPNQLEDNWWQGDVKQKSVAMTDDFDAVINRQFMKSLKISKVCMRKVFY